MKKFIKNMEERTGIDWSLMVIYLVAVLVMLLDMMLWRPH
jgi:hypothetical protein